MNWKFLKTSFFVPLALATMVTAGEIRVDSAVSAVQLSNSLSLSCKQLRCDSDGPLFSFLTGRTGGSSVLAPTLLNVSNGFRIQGLGLAGVTTGTPAPAFGMPASTAGSSNTADNTAPSFVLGGDQVVRVSNTSQSGSGFVNLDALPAPAPTIVSPAFNVLSTTLVAAPVSSSNTPPTVPIAASLPNLPGASTTPESAAAALVPLIPLVDLTTTSNGLNLPDRTAGGASDPAMPGTEPATGASVTGAEFPATATGAGLPADNAPEPGTELLIGAGLVALGIFSRSRQRA